MDIDGLGEKQVALFQRLGLVRTAADFYRLAPEPLLELEGFGEVSVERLLRSIEASRARPFGTVLFAIGIEGVGYVTGRSLAAALPHGRRAARGRRRSRSPRRPGSARSSPS